MGTIFEDISINMNLGIKKVLVHFSLEYPFKAVYTHYDIIDAYILHKCSPTQVLIIGQIQKKIERKRNMRTHQSIGCNKCMADMEKFYCSNSCFSHPYSLFF